MIHPHRGVPINSLRVSLSISLSFCFAALLTGCSSIVPGAEQAVLGTQITPHALHGKTFGGQQPIAGAHVHLLEAATTGYGAASISDINSGYDGSDSVGNYVLSDAGGNFDITGYACTSGSQVYVLAEQGNPGAGNNTAVALMAPFGTCSLSGTISGFVNINEVSTVVTAFAIAGFATDAVHVASSNSALAAIGLQNAFAAIPNLINVPNGSAYTATAGTNNGVVPQTKINTLANILATCVNSSGPASETCTVLFANATSDGTANGAHPSDTATAAINIAHHPSSTLDSHLFGLQGSMPPFAPNLMTMPNDFTLKIYYTGGGLNQSSQLAVDGAGNVWVASQGNNSMNEFSPMGLALSPSTGFTGGGLNNPHGVAIDISGNAWVANYSGNNISEFSPQGLSLAGTTGFTGNGDLAPYELAIDISGNVWTTNLANSSVSKLDPSGNEILNNISSGNFTSPAGIAIDAASQVWVADQSNQYTLVLDNTTGNYNNYFFCSYACSSLALTSGASPSAWLSDGNAYISNGTGNQSQASDYTGGGLNTSTSNVIDGAGNVWVTNGNGTVSEFNSGGTPITRSSGYITSLTATSGIAIDPSGNVWITDSGTTNKLAELLGAATPAETPLVQAAIDDNIAGRP